MSEQKQEWANYIDTAANLVDIEPADLDGACGSNWHWNGWTEEEARGWLAEMLAKGWMRGSNHAQRFGYTRGQERWAIYTNPREGLADVQVSQESRGGEPGEGWSYPGYNAEQARAWLQEQNAPNQGHTVPQRVGRTRDGECLMPGAHGWLAANDPVAVRDVLCVWESLACRAEEFGEESQRYDARRQLPPLTCSLVELSQWACGVLNLAHEVEGNNAPCAGVFWTPNYTRGYALTLWWCGTWTQGRWVSVEVNYGPDSPSGQAALEVRLFWDSGTGLNSTFLSQHCSHGVFFPADDQGRNPVRVWDYVTRQERAPRPDDNQPLPMHPWAVATGEPLQLPWGDWYYPEEGCTAMLAWRLAGLAGVVVVRPSREFVLLPLTTGSGPWVLGEPVPAPDDVSVTTFSLHSLKHSLVTLGQARQHGWTLRRVHRDDRQPEPLEPAESEPHPSGMGG